MNIAELARKLNISLQELREVLPQVGFDVGSKAIKVDEVIANRIIKDWHSLYREYLLKQQKEKKVNEKILAQSEVKLDNKIVPIKISNLITVKDFAFALGIPIVKVIGELMKNGVLATLNEKIDYETASIIADDFGYKTELIAEGTESLEENEIEKTLAQEREVNLKKRPPVVVIMGHVDHGKTQLLDTIRKTNVISQEAGGITQHIGAYQVSKPITNFEGKMEEKLITFIDTPGHEAFTAMRSRGAKIADIAILVVAADDGVMPQTKEAIKIIEQAKIPMIVAINKIDKPEANIEKTKKQLSELNLIPEDWGGNVTCVSVSAKKQVGIEDLLTAIIMTAEIQEDKIKANPDAQALGTVIESHINKGEGPVATIVVQNGTVRQGEYILVNNDIYGKIRVMKNHLGNEILLAGPSMPARIIGLKILPKVGDVIKTSLEKEGKMLKKRNLTKMAEGFDWHRKDEMISRENTECAKSINIILKTDVVGSLEAIMGSLAKIESEEVKINVIKKGLGNISEADVIMAVGDQAIILGFNVILTQEAAKLALEKNVEFHIYKIIYDLLGLIKGKIQALTEPKYEYISIGKLKALRIFRTERKYMIIGGKIIEGEIRLDSSIKVLRNANVISEGKLSELESAKQKVSICFQDQECGIKYEGEPVIKEGDILEFFARKEIK